MIWLAVLLTVIAAVVGAFTLLVNLNDPDDVFHGGGVILSLAGLAALCWTLWALGVGVEVTW